jgi:hypothetical protein
MSLEPGLYAGVPEAVYFSLDAWSNSRLKTLEKSPEEAQENTSGSDGTDTQAQSLGSAAHCALGEPVRFAEEYSIRTRCFGLTQQDNRCKHWGKHSVGGKWYCGRHRPEGAADPIVGILPKEMEQIQEWFKLLYECEENTELGSPGHFEVVAIWVDPETGLKCKGRIDFLSLVGGYIKDWKTSREGAPWAFPYHMERWRYDRQHAFYMKGMKALAPHVKAFYFVALGKDGVVSVHTLPDHVARQATEEVNALLQLAKKYSIAGHWPKEGSPVHTVTGWGAEMALANADGFSFGFLPEE